MILEEIDGNVSVVLNGKNLAVGDSIEDSQYGIISVLGKGKAIFRASPNTTAEIKGKEISVQEITPTPAPAPVPAPVPTPKTVVKSTPKPAVDETPTE